ncbi:MAG: PqqD family protein [Alphaproteobacteria bacterium]|nr:PqqD family protein [Alphaproteobacteria bacterium]
MPQINTNNVFWREKDGVVTVLVIATGEYFEFNRVGSAVWKGIAEGLAADAIIDRLAQTYDTTREQLAIDVHALIVKMIARELIEE